MSMNIIYILLAAAGSGALLWFANERVHGGPSGFGRLPYWIFAMLWPLFILLMSRGS
jgi:hypothetical protein